MTGGMQRALLVEDDSRVASATALLLERLGYRVRWADAALSAISAIAETPDFSLAVIDILLPGPQDGIDLLRTIRRTDIIPLVPVVVVSGSYGALTSAARMAAEYRAAFLRKPYGITDMTWAIEHAQQVIRGGMPDATPQHAH